MKERTHREQAITQQLRVLFKAVQAHSKRVEKLCGLSSAKLWMLHEITSAPGIKVSQLAKVLSIHPSTCSNMLDKIEDRELIYRNRSKTDQRTVHLYPTQKGTKLLSHAPSPPQGKLSSTLQKLSQPQLANLEKSLEVLLLALHFEDDKAAFTPISNE
ncbi:MAG: MarR family transcriptional regulator [Desulfobacterales bacterium]|nr:MarR family transcriptional regulator [Deltaproteobacteria bacterium]NNK93451.1 MarR family transcriptional regulator [Desulfobacterales bacterium]